MFKIVNNIRTNIRMNINSNRRIFILYTILRILIIIAMIRAIFNGNYNGAAFCLLSLLLFLVPSLMENGFQIHIPPALEACIYLFIFAAEILGEVKHFYVAIPGWDTMLHTINGFLAAAIGFSMIELLNNNSKKISLSPFYLAMVAFCFSMTIGVLWEFIEFSADQLFNMDMQKDFIISTVNSVTLDPTHSQTVISVKDIVQTDMLTADGTVHTIQGGYLDIGIADTMKDLFVNFIGALVFCTIGFIMLLHDSKHKNNGGKGNIASSFIVHRVSDDADNENYAFNSEGFSADND